MKITPVFLWTDLLVYLLVITVIISTVWSLRQEHWREPWGRVGQRKLGIIALVILIAYSFIGLLDSIHFRNNKSLTAQTQGIQSLLDVLLRPLGAQDEESYSAPFALALSSKTTIIENNQSKAIHPRLKFGGVHLTSAHDKARDITKKSARALMVGVLLGLLPALLFIAFFSAHHHISFKKSATFILHGHTKIAWREVIITLWCIILIITYIKMLTPYYHILGTDKIGNDILYEAIKSIRTGLIIGTLTTLVMLPFAVWLGTSAGYFGGWRDDIIQYIYTTLSSIPGVLLISAAVLSLEIFFTNHPTLFASLESRADARLLALCIILGITSWTSLCRLLRGETLKLREIDFVKASVAMGVRNLKIIWRHIIPNVMHIILITVVLDFSGLVLAEAVLSYVGVGVDPTTESWGNMINSARLDLAREPIVWWPLFSAFIFMFTLVLAANLFADALRDAFDPRLKNVT